MRKRLPVIVVLLAALLLVACGGSEPVEIEIEMEDFQFEPAEISFPAGEEVHLTLRNGGTFEHELLIGRNPGDGYATDLFDRDPSQVTIEDASEGFHVGGDEDIAEEGYHVELEPGASGTLVFTVPDSKVGEWEMGCFIDDGSHYDAGMHGTVTVTE